MVLPDLRGVAVAVAIAEVDSVAAPVAVEEQLEVGRKNGMKSIHLLLIVALCLLSMKDTSQAQVQIPLASAQDGQGNFTHDYVGVLNGQKQLDRIAAAQKKAFEKYDTPLIVVVITRMSSYGYCNSRIEPFATQWFNKWEIGTEKSNGKNQGVLLLVSINDRKARIELGKDWGHDFDKHCQLIMDNVIISQFKQGDYSTGIVEGTEALLKMISIGPAGPINKLPKPNSNSAIPFSVSRSRTSFEISWTFRIILILIGTTGIILGIFFTPNSYLKKCGICVGLGLLIIGIFPQGPQRVYFSLILFAIGIIPNVLLKSLGSIDFSSSSYSGGSYSGGSYSGGYSGGGYSGGSSGGGGASGSW